MKGGGAAASAQQQDTGHQQQGRGASRQDPCVEGGGEPSTPHGTAGCAQLTSLSCSFFNKEVTTVAEVARVSDPVSLPPFL